MWMGGGGGGGLFVLLSVYCIFYYYVCIYLYQCYYNCSTFGRTLYMQREDEINKKGKKGGGGGGEEETKRKGTCLIIKFTMLHQDSSSLDDQALKVDKEYD